MPRKAAWPKETRGGDGQYGQPGGQIQPEGMRRPGGQQGGGGEQEQKQSLEPWGEDAQNAAHL